MPNSDTLKRWLPTGGAPLIAGVLAGLLAWGLLQVHVVVLPSALATALTPVVALLAHAIVDKQPPAPEAPAQLPTHGADAKPTT